MKLGYLSLASGSAPDGSRADRADYAQAHGFSEVLAFNPAALAHGVSDPDVPAGAMAPSTESGPCLRLVRGGVGQAEAVAAGDRIAARPSIVPVGRDLHLLRRLSRAGHHPLSISTLDVEAVAAHWPAHVEGCTHASIRACPSQWRLARTILTSREPARAAAAVRDPEGPCHAHYASVLGPQARAADVLALIDRVVIHGTPETVAESLIDIRERCGPFGTLVLVDHDWADADLARQSISLISKHVWPAIAADTRTLQSVREFA